MHRKDIQELKDELKDEREKRTRLQVRTLWVAGLFPIMDGSNLKNVKVNVKEKLK